MHSLSLLQLRAIWYTLEVAAKDLTNSDFVWIGWFKNTTMWDFGAVFLQKLIYYEKSCFPIKGVASHICCLPSVVLRILQPFHLALMDSRDRFRIIMHDVPEHEVVEALSNYGIEKRMLPMEMGGSFEYNPSEWIANQRAAEMEEL